MRPLKARGFTLAEALNDSAPRSRPSLDDWCSRKHSLEEVSLANEEVLFLSVFVNDHSDCNPDSLRGLIVGHSRRFDCLRAT